MNKKQAISEMTEMVDLLFPSEKYKVESYEVFYAKGDKEPVVSVSTPMFQVYNYYERKGGFNYDLHMSGPIKMHRTGKNLHKLLSEAVRDLIDAHNLEIFKLVQMNTNLWMKQTRKEEDNEATPTQDTSKAV